MLRTVRSVSLVMVLLVIFASCALADALPISPTKVSLPKSVSVMKARTITLTPTLNPIDASTTYTWTSSKKKVATVLNGVVTGVNPGTTVITVRTANGKKAYCSVKVSYVPMTGFTVTVKDWLGDPCTYSIPDTYWEVVGHHLYTSIGDIVPSDANKSIVWKSSKKSVATVNSKGVVTCKKPGFANITATSKYGGYMASLPVYVVSNSNSFTVAEAFGDISELEEDYWYSSAKRIYLKGGYVYVDMYILNLIDGYTIRRLGRQTVRYTENCIGKDYGDYDYAGTYKVSLKKKIPPNSVGVVTIKLSKLGKFNAAKQWMVVADAYCTGAVYSKEAGFELPKASVPSISAISGLRAHKTSKAFPFAK